MATQQEFHKRLLEFNDDFINFLTVYGALMLEVEENIWKRPKEMEITARWKFI